MVVVHVIIIFMTNKSASNDFQLSVNIDSERFELSSRDVSPVSHLGVLSN